MASHAAAALVPSATADHWLWTSSGFEDTALTIRFRAGTIEGYVLRSGAVELPVGQMVLRGSLQQDGYIGEILRVNCAEQYSNSLSPCSDEFFRRCTNLRRAWTPVELWLDEDGGLSGVSRTLDSADRDCRPLWGEWANEELRLAGP